MNSKSLSIQIWIWFMGIIVGICIILGLTFYVSLEKFLKEQTYTYIEEEQKNEMRTIKSTENILAKTIPATPIVKESVEHVIVPQQNYEGGKAMVLSSAIKTEIAQQAKAQETENQRYEKTVGNKKLLYVISKQDVGNESVYVYSYVLDNLKRTIVTQFSYVFIVILLVLLFMLIPAHIIANRVTKPLVMLEGDMERIANRDWDKPINVEGSEEIVSLSKSCEWMRNKLIAYDDKQQSMFQNISHELKTPIMVIRSYIQSMKDGFYPKGTLDGTIEVIDQEAKRLEKKVLDLIYIANLEYLAQHKKLEEDVKLKVILEEVYERLQYKRQNINWKLELQDLVIKGDHEQWKVVFENILQNQLRYSKDRIEVFLRKGKGKIICRIYNNGPYIEKAQQNKLFNAFEKGIKGESGLGLTIVKRIVDMYEGKVWIENEDEGVAFYISIPMSLEE